MSISFIAYRHPCFMFGKTTLIDNYEEDLENQSGRKIRVTNEISFDEASNTKLPPSHLPTIEQGFKASLDIEVEGYALSVDNKDLVILKTAVSI